MVTACQLMMGARVEPAKFNTNTNVQISKLSFRITEDYVGSSKIKWDLVKSSRI